MRGERLTILILLLITLSTLVSAQFEEQEGSTEYDVGNPQSDPQAWQDQMGNDHGVNIDVGSGDGMSYNEQAGILTYSGGEIDLKNFRGSTIKISGNTVTVDGQELSNADKTTKRGGSLYATDVESAEMSGTTPYIFEHVERLEHDGFIINQGSEVEFDGVEFNIASADSIIINGGVATQVLEFEGGRSSFRVKQADQVQIRCLVLDDVRNTDFTVYADRTKAEPDEDELLRITDCTQTQTTYTASADAEVTITEQAPITYTVRNGKVVYETATHRDILETEEASELIFDFYDGFKCMSMSPKASYYYVDKLDARRDLTVSNPEYGNLYTLCLKRTVSQTFSSDGLIDFIENRVYLQNTIDLLRYPLKDGQLIGTQLTYFYRGLTDPVMELVMNNFITGVQKQNVPTISQTASRTHLNNFYEIIEEPINGEMHTLIHLNEIEEAHDSRLEEYNGIVIDDSGILRTGNMEILPPNHPKIKELLDG